MKNLDTGYHIPYTNKTVDQKIRELNKRAKSNWEIRFHGNLIDINFPDSPVTPDYEDFNSLDEALDEVLSDLLPRKEEHG